MEQLRLTITPKMIQDEAARKRYTMRCETDGCPTVFLADDSLSFLTGGAKGHVERTGHTVTISERVPEPGAPDCHAIQEG